MKGDEKATAQVSDGVVARQMREAIVALRPLSLFVFEFVSHAEEAAMYRVLAELSPSSVPLAALMLSSNGGKRDEVHELHTYIRPILGACASTLTTLTIDVDHPTMFDAITGALGTSVVHLESLEINLSI